MSEENEMMMDDDNWNSRVEKIQAFIKEHQKELKTDEDYAESLDIIKTQIKRGARRAEMRKKYWNAILLEGRTLPHWPIKKGKESSLPQNIQDALSAVSEELTQVYTDFWNNNPIVQVVETVSDRNKTLGGQPHPSAESYVKSKNLAVKQLLTKHFQNDRWTGTFSLDEDDEGNIVGLDIAPPPTDNEGGNDAES